MTYKQNWSKFKEIIRDKNIKSLYHFTDRSNLQSIIESGGLYSWKSCESKNIIIPRAGGSNLSQVLDSQVGIGDYVHLSFIPQHPMLYDTIEDGRITNPILLISVCKKTHNYQALNHLVKEEPLKKYIK